MFIKLIYIFFTASTDFLLYNTLNKKNKVNSKIVWLYVITFLFVLVLHTGLFNLTFLMPIRHFLIVFQFLIELIVFHIVGKYYINRTQVSSRLSPKIANLSIKMASFIFLKGIYMILFIVQCIFIINSSN